MLSAVDFRSNPPTRFALWSGSGDWTPPANFYVSGFMVGGFGAVEVVSEIPPNAKVGDDVVIPSSCITPGVQYAVHFAKLKAAGTTATSIVIFGHYLV
jgi:hypothetical protein